MAFRAIVRTQVAFGGGHLSLLGGFGFLTDTYGQTLSQFEEGFYQFDLNEAAANILDCQLPIDTI